MPGPSLWLVRVENDKRQPGFYCVWATGPHMAEHLVTNDEKAVPGYHVRPEGTKRWANAEEAERAAAYRLNLPHGMTALNA